MTARQYEAAKQAQSIVRDNPNTEKSEAGIDAIKRQTRYRQDKRQTIVNTNREKEECPRCGYTPTHQRSKCPANNKTCSQCGKVGHFAKKCRSRANLSDKPVAEIADEVDDLFLGVIEVDEASARPWTAQVTTTLSENDGGTKNITYKLDSGAAVTVCSPSELPSNVDLAECTKRLVGPGGAEIPCLGIVEASLTYGQKHIKENIYAVSNQKVNLLSKRACEALGLLTCSVNETNVNEYESVFEGLGQVKNVFYDIKLVDDFQPYAINVPRPVPIPLLSKTKAELERMVDLGVIEKVTKPTDWCSPMVVIPKSNGGVRICSDVTRLNKYVKREVFPMATVDDSIAQVSGRVFSKLDANSGFWQIPLGRESQELTTFLTPFGRFMYKKLPFGLCSSPEIFYREMLRILEGTEGVVIHMDDVLVFGDNDEQHDTRLKLVLQKIKDSGMTLNRKKCEFGKTKVNFLGHTLDEHGIHASEERIQSILGFHTPTCVKDIQSFLGLVNQSARFSPNIATLSKPLRDLLQKNAPWIWDSQQQNSFEKLKLEFSKPPVLVSYDVNKETIISTDASNQGLGAIMTQVQDDGTARLIAAASRSLTSAEEGYAVIEKEALGVTWALEKFSKYLLGLNSFVVQTDHKPLVPLLGEKPLHKMPPRIQRFKLRLMRYKFKIVHVAGKQNNSADALSRYPENSPTIDELNAAMDIEDYASAYPFPATDVKLESLAKAQKADEVLQIVRNYVETSWPAYLSSTDGVIKPYFEKRALITRHPATDLLLYQDRIIIPQSERVEMLRKIHEGHLGITKCTERAKKAIWWPSINRFIEEMINSCITCRNNGPEVKQPLRPIETPARPWQVIASDLFHFKGKNYLLVVDLYSRYPEFALLRSMTSQEVIKHLKSIFARHGIPELMISDNGGQYASEEFKRFAAHYQFRAVTSSPMYPRANGAAERMVQTMKNILEKSPDPYLGLLAYRTSPLSTGFSPAQLMMNRELRSTVPAITSPSNDIRHTEHYKRNEIYKKRMKENHDSRHQVKELSRLSAGDKVYIRDMQRTGIVQQEFPGTRSYNVESEGNQIRRNRSALIYNPPPKGDPPESAVTRSPLVTESPTPEPPVSRVRRSNRNVLKPRRLIEEC